jgi:hypothetical protein
MIVYRRAAGLDEENVIAPHGLVQHDMYLGIGQVFGRAAAKLYTQPSGDLLGQGEVGRSGKDSQRMGRFR